MSTSDGSTLRAGRQDVFGTPTRNTLKNVLDIGSHYPINPERLRLRVDGSREFPMYGSVSQYNHRGDVHELSPDQNQTVVLQTAERPRYAVGFEQLMSLAMGLSRQLQDGDRVRVGLFDDDEGWFLEQTHGMSQNIDLVERRGGTDETTNHGEDLARPLTDFQRMELRTAWYRVTRQLWRQSTAKVSGEQITQIIGSASSTGPTYGNLPIRYEITRGSTDPITMEAGSCALITQGDKSTIRRVKSHEVTFTTDGSADGNTWIPQYAMRLDPDRKIVDVQLTALEVNHYAGNGDIRVALMAHDPSNVLDGSQNELVDADFDVPVEHSAQNSVVQESFAVEEAADSTGATTTSASDPGGYQVGYAGLISESKSTSGARSAPQDIRKRSLYDGDIAILWSRADNSGATVTLTMQTEQDW